MLEACLKENLIGFPSERNQNGTSRIFVLPEDASRARPSVGEIEESSPPWHPGHPGLSFSKPIVIGYYSEALKENRGWFEPFRDALKVQQVRVMLLGAADKPAAKTQESRWPIMT
jgi:hypothetical protein